MCNSYELNSLDITASFVVQSFSGACNNDTEKAQRISVF